MSLSLPLPSGSTAPRGPRSWRRNQRATHADDNERRTKGFLKKAKSRNQVCSIVLCVYVYVEFNIISCVIAGGVRRSTEFDVRAARPGVDVQVWGVARQTTRWRVVLLLARCTGVCNYHRFVEMFCFSYQHRWLCRIIKNCQQTISKVDQISPKLFVQDIYIPMLREK